MRGAAVPSSFASPWLPVTLRTRRPSQSTRPVDQTTTYRDPAGWTADISVGWSVPPFETTRGDASANGMQISNVDLPAPSIEPGLHIQAGGLDLPPTSLSLTSVRGGEVSLTRRTVVISSTALHTLGGPRHRSTGSGSPGSSPHPWLPTPSASPPHLKGWASLRYLL
jgi:hypothetical protein